MSMNRVRKEKNLRTLSGGELIWGGYVHGGNDAMLRGSAGKRSPDSARLNPGATSPSTPPDPAHAGIRTTCYKNTKIDYDNCVRIR